MSGIDSAAYTELRIEYPSKGSSTIRGKGPNNEIAQKTGIRINAGKTTLNEELKKMECRVDANDRHMLDPYYGSPSQSAGGQCPCGFVAYSGNCASVAPCGEMEGAGALYRRKNYGRQYRKSRQPATLPALATG